MASFVCTLPLQSNAQPSMWTASRSYGWQHGFQSSTVKGCCSCGSVITV